MPHRLSTAILSALLAGLAPASGQAQQQEDPVTMEIHGLFGDDLPFHHAHAPLSVEVRNRTARTFRGEVLVTVSQWQGAPAKHTVPLDLPPNERRRVTLEIFGLDGASVTGSYRADGRQLASASFTPPYSPTAQAVVVLADPPRLRPALLDLEAEQRTQTDPWRGGGGVNVVRLPIGAVAFDPSSGDPMLPTRSVGWSTTALLVASAPQLARAGAAEQEALTDWVRSGGQVLVFPRSEGDLREPFLRSLVGEVERFEAAPSSDQIGLVPEGARGARYRGSSSGFRSEPYGGSRRLGFGRVHVASFDGAAPPLVEAPETRALVRAIVSVPAKPGVDAPLLPFGRGHDDASGGAWYGSGPTFSVLRAALDPNEAYRPALGLVAVVLLVYVLVVGPLNFAFVGKRNRPTLALATTPVAACGCLVLMLGVGYIGKGTQMRYRAVEVVELREGDAQGPARRYSGLFSTRPASFDLPSPERGVVSVIRSGGTDLSHVTDHGEDRPVLRGVRSRLWETVFVREDRIADLGGAVSFERVGPRLVAVRNGTPHELKGVVLVDGGGSVYRVGTLPAGGRAAVPQHSEMNVDPASTPFWGEDDPNLRRLASLLELPPDRDESLDGTIKLLGGGLGIPSTSILFAWIEDGSPEEIAGTFDRESALRLVRVVPDEDAPPVRPVLGDATDQGAAFDSLSGPIGDPFAVPAEEPGQ